MLAHAFLSVICAESKNTIVVDASPSNIPSSVTVGDASTSPLPITSLPPPKISPPTFPTPPQVFTSSALPTHSPTPQISPLVPVPSTFSSPPRLCLAPLTVPEVRHLLACLIWPMATNAKLGLAWSEWRRRHRGMSSDFHTKHDGSLCEPEEKMKIEHL